jgi:type II secretory pathway pseudopilin PulG
MNIISTKLNNRGDTIVEVLICMALVSLVLGSAYVTVNHNLRDIRSAQERGEVLELVRGQFEQLRDWSATDTNVVTSMATRFCMVNGAPVGLPPATFCNGMGIYKVSITRSANTFTAIATWDKVGGGTENLTMSYGVYQ